MLENKAKLDKKTLRKTTKIAKVAARLFCRKGFLETTMDEIAAAAKISKGGMYYYFPSKTEVLHFILSNYMDLVLENLEQNLSHINGNEDKVKFIISRHIELYANKASEARVLLHDAHCLPTKYFKVIAEKERKYFQIVSRVLSGFFGGSLPRGQLTSATFVLFGMCNWIYSWYDPKGAIAPQELSKIIWTVFLKGASGISHGISGMNGHAFDQKTHENEV